MTKLLYSIAFVLFFLPINAQAKDAQTEIQSLIHKVDSLEHELSYLRLEYELNKYLSDLNMLANEVRTVKIEILSSFYNKDFNKRMGNSYIKLYESYLNKTNVYHELVEKIKHFLKLKFVSSSYTTTQKDNIMATSNLIGRAYDVLEKTMNVLKEAIDLYNKCL